MRCVRPRSDSCLITDGSQFCHQILNMLDPRAMRLTSRRHLSFPDPGVSAGNDLQDGWHMEQTGSGSCSGCPIRYSVTSWRWTLVAPMLVPSARLSLPGWKATALIRVPWFWIDRLRGDATGTAGITASDLYLRSTNELSSCGDKHQCCVRPLIVS